MQLNEHQLRLWSKMQNSIERFRKGELQYYDFVYELEGFLDAGDFHDNDLIRQWYDRWTPLEILCAQKENKVTIEDVDKYLSDMESFLIEVSHSA